MEKSLKLLEFDKVLDILSGYASSPLGKEKCLNLSLLDTDEAKNEIRLANEAKNLFKNALEPDLSALKDVIPFIERAKAYQTLDTEEILAIAGVLKTTRLTKSFLERNCEKEGSLIENAQNLYPDKDFEERIFATFDENKNVKDSASPELKSLKNAGRDTENNLKKIISELLNSPDFVQNLQDTIWTKRADRVVFQVKAECKNKVEGIVQDVSASGQTYFIEPKTLVPVNNKLKEISIKILTEIERILNELSSLAAQKSDEITISVETLAKIDFIFAKAKYSQKSDFCAPELTQERIINLKDMKNPVLMQVCDNVIENNFYLDQEKNVLLITGSNTGGKTVSIKTAGLITAMARSGLHVPCHEAKIYPFKKIFADIGDEQSIIESLSTFSSHMKNIINILNSADNETLAILDEIAVGTDPQEGASIAQAILEYLQVKGAFVLCTTHYGELKSLAYTHNGFKNASVEFNLDTLSPTYKLLMDIPGASNAIYIADNLGMKKEISERARQIHFTQKDKTAQVLQELQQTRQTLSVSAKEAQVHEENAKNLEREFEQKLSEIKKHKKKNLDTYKKKYENQIANAKSEIKEIMEEIRAKKSEKAAHRAYQRLADFERKAREEFQDDADKLMQKYTPIDWKTIKINDRVLVKNLDQEASVLDLPDKNNNVQILMGVIKTKIKKDKLAKFDKNIAPKKLNSPKTRREAKFEFERHNMSQTLDLRGFRVEEALDEIEAFFDKASLVNLTPLYIIHGHGTGALKSVIRDYIKNSPYVSKFRAGENAEGGDGVTVVDIV